MNQKKIGSSFEEEFAELLSEHGYWAHIVAPNTKDGSQPFDVIATKNDKFYAFDCKACKSEKFPLSRVESNQIYGFKRLHEVKSTSCYFAFKTPSGIYLGYAAEVVGYKDKGDKQFDVSTCATFDKWVNSPWK